MIGPSLAAVAFGAAIGGRDTRRGVLAFWGILGLEEAWAWHGCSEVRRALSGPGHGVSGGGSALSCRAQISAPSETVPAPGREGCRRSAARQRGAASRSRPRPPTAATRCQALCESSSRPASGPAAFTWRSVRRLRDARVIAGTTRRADARIKTAQLLPYGVRLDLKLAAETEQTAACCCVWPATSAESGSCVGRTRERRKVEGIRATRA